MKVLVSILLLATVDALQLPSHKPQDVVRRPNHGWLTPGQTPMCTAVATAAALLLWSPLPAAAAEDTTSVQVNVNVPALIQLVKTKEARQSTADQAQFVADVIRRNIGPLVDVAPPSNIQGFVRKALTGQAAVTVNGQETVTVQVIGSDPGALTLQIRNPRLPKLPLVGLPQTPPIVNAVAPLIEKAAPAALEFVVQQQQQQSAAANGGFWTTPVDNLVVAGRALSPLDILGSASLALGAAYGGSYAFYMYEQDREAREAADKKAAMAEKREAAAKAKQAAKPNVDTKKQNKGNDTKSKDSIETEKVDLKVEEKPDITAATPKVVEKVAKESPAKESPSTNKDDTKTKEINTSSADEVNMIAEMKNTKSEYPLAITIKAITDKKPSKDSEDPPAALKIKSSEQIQLQRSKEEISTETVLKTKRSGGIRGFFQRLFGLKKQE